MCALFTLKQIKKVNKLDVEFGCNFNDPEMIDCFEILNALPRREHRKLIQRVYARKSIAAIELDDKNMKKLDQALDEKYPTESLITPRAELPPFTPDDFDNGIL